MQTQGPSQQVIRFKAFELNLQTHELRRSGIRLKIHGQPIAVLRLLLQHPGEVISRESLCRALWHDGTFVEFEHGLNSNINRLRATLGDRANAPRFIETVPKQGYRFIGRVAPDSPTNEARTGIRLAVLPFTCVGAPVDDNFGEGFTAQTIVQLGKSCKTMSIVSPLTQRWSSSQQLTRSLKADYLLAGAIWRNPPSIHVSSQLVRASDSCCIWSETYTRLESEMFFLPEKIASDIATQFPEPRPSTVALSESPLVPSPSSPHPCL
jgi:DNA-binding winged helix-turn-helix (wHTH) protein